ncbi:MAG TPA: kinase [Xanthomonadaceae bacterium]|nr:kinase [Xanthomonadaceae bacterium]
MPAGLHHPALESAAATGIGTASAAGWSPAFVGERLADALARGLRVHAIAGLQGTGKSTLAMQLVAAARGRGLGALALSIDDFYLGRRDRQRLGRTVHPLCATRGPPGTHDVALACDVLDALAAGQPARLPRFDKIADRRLPPSRWPLARGTDLVVFEGWFLKVPPQPSAALRAPVNALERNEDPDGTWRRWANDALAHDYAALWTRLPRMLFLQPPGFEVVPEWRWQQELTLQAAHPGRRAMDHAQVMRFVQFFERTSCNALATLPAIADEVVRVDAARRVVPRSAD